MKPQAYERLKERYMKLIGSKCNSCGEEYFPKLYRCRKCGSADLIDKIMPDTGTLISYTLLRVTAKEFKGLEPLAIALVELDNGVRVLGQISIEGSAKISPGMRLKLVSWRSENLDEGLGLLNNKTILFKPA